MNLRRLGKTELMLSPLGLGTWQFSEGQGIGSNFWKTIPYEEMKKIVDISLKMGINWIDTAEAYGNGAAEKNVGKIIAELKNDRRVEVHIADKWWPLARSAKSLPRTINERLNLLQMEQITLYQIHHPTSFSSIERQMIEMCKLVEKQKIRYVGVSNFSASQMEKASSYLKDAGAFLASNQVSYNLIDKAIERNGVIETAKKLGIAIIAYSPLQQGLLTGKFHEDPSKIRKLFWLKKVQYGLFEKNLEKSRPLIECLKFYAEKYKKTPAQIALNWLIHSQGETVFAIPGATSLQQAEKNLDSLSFQLSEQERLELSQFY